MVETLEDGALEDTNVSKEFIGRIHRDVDRMRDIVEELLELSRLESGLFPLALIEVNPYSLIQEIKSVFQSQAENKNISITLNDSDNIPNIKCEKRKIHQVLSNLVDNSLKFTPDAGHIQISVALAGNSVLFEVSDSGLGIPQEDQPHVFERFYRVDSSREHKGTGLGLSIAKHIIEAHGGTITLTSSEGHGSNFAFTIPI
jgi:signal transduction histidine kinase